MLEKIKMKLIDDGSGSAPLDESVVVNLEWRDGPSLEESTVILVRYEPHGGLEYGILYKDPRDGRWAANVNDYTTEYYSVESSESCANLEQVHETSEDASGNKS